LLRELLVQRRLLLEQQMAVALYKLLELVYQQP
jgi:hypothetical protein